MIGFRISKQEPSEFRAGFLSSNRCPSEEVNRGNSCWKSSYKPRRPKVVRRDTRTFPLLGSQKDWPFPAPPLWTYAHLSWKPQGTNLPKLLVCVKPVSSHASCSPGAGNLGKPNCNQLRIPHPSRELIGGPDTHLSLLQCIDTGKFWSLTLRLSNNHLPSQMETSCCYL